MRDPTSTGPTSSVRRASITKRLLTSLNDPLHRFQASLFLLGLVVVVGTVGFVLISDLSLINALYMTVITITTVGFGEISEPTNLSRAFTIVLILLGVGTGAWAIRNGVEVALGDTLWHSVQRKKMMKTIESLEGHYIICGFGRIGRQIARDMTWRNEKFLIIDNSQERIDWIRDANYNYVSGDATLDETLYAAGITRAAGLIAALTSDANNVLAVLTARGLNPNLVIVARAGNDSAESKLKRAGADRVVSPYVIGGHRLALSMLQPTVHDFFNRVFNVEHPDVDLGELLISDDCPLVGKSIAECQLRKQWELIIIGIKQLDCEFTVSPEAHRVINAGETIIAMGSPDKLDAFQKAYGSVEENGRRSTMRFFDRK